MIQKFAEASMRLPISLAAALPAASKIPRAPVSTRRWFIPKTLCGGRHIHDQCRESRSRAGIDGTSQIGEARAVILNSGNANACTGDTGLADTREMAAAAASHLGLDEKDVLVCSTGRIGVPLPMDRIEAGVKKVKLTRNRQ